MNPPGFVKVAPYSRFTEARQSGPDDDTDLLDFDRGVEAEAEAQSLNTHLPSSNMGYKLALKMGWKEGHGLGKRETGKCPLSPHQRPEKVIQTMNWIVCHYPEPQPIHCVSEGWHWRSFLPSGRQVGMGPLVTTVLPLEEFPVLGSPPCR